MKNIQSIELTNMCLIYNKDKVLVINRTKNDWPSLSFPGGHIKKKEDIITSVIREVKEETGLIISNPILCGIEEYKPPKGSDRYLTLFFKANKYKGKLKSSKEGEVFWMNKEELLKRDDLSLDLDLIYKVMTSDNLSDLIYYKRDKKWKKRTI